MRILTLTVSSLLTLLIASSGLTNSASAETISEMEYDTGMNQIDVTYNADKASCEDFSGNKKDICLEQAKTIKSTSQSVLEARYKGTNTAYLAAAREKANGNYNVSEQVCDDYAGDTKALCLAKAKAERDSALADIEANRKVYEARKEATDKKVEADYTVALKKCDMLSGKSKDTCENNAKKLYKQ
ncbi:MAG: hypothetical protein ACAH12_05520 [Methylophilaceae bacterium]